MSTQTSKEVAEELLYGQKATFTLPSGYHVTIREQNGNDDDILSNASTAKDLTNINIFLSSLILDTDLPFATGRKLSSAAVKKMLLKDRYFIIFASRIHSMGHILNFEFDWGKDEGGKLEYNDNLEDFLYDYDEPVPVEGEEGYKPHAITPYPPNAYDLQTLTLASGKELQYNLLNGESEQYLMKLPIDQQTRNAELKARNLKLNINGDFKLVENFVHFTKRDMAEIAKEIMVKDKQFDGSTELENPKTGQTILFPVISAVGFLFPEEI